MVLSNGKFSEKLLNGIFFKQTVSDAVIIK